jgi:Toprim domain/Origin of replication binding protein
MGHSGNKLTSFDILNHASGHISVIAANCGVDFDKLYPQITKGRTAYSKCIAIDRKHNGKVKTWINFKTAHNGQEYPVITFNTLKGGGYSETFNGYQWLLDHKDEKFSAPSARPVPRPAVKKDDSHQYKINRYNKFQSVYNDLPILADSTNTYLGSKGIDLAELPPTFIIKRGQDDRGYFIAYELTNTEGKRPGYQKIYDRPFIDSNGTSRNKDFVFLPDSKNGSFAIIGQPTGSTVYLAEGLATALSIYISTGIPTAVCLDAGNLIHVANALKSTFKHLIICADNDINPTGNVGIESAIRAARAVGADHIVYPELGDRKVDFNDLHLALGIDAVLDQISNNKISLHGNITPLLVKYAHGNHSAVSHNITHLNTRFLPDSVIKPGVSIIKATYGTGKTFAAAKYIEAHPGESVLYIAHLQTLCGQASSRFAIENYGDHKSGLYEHRCLSICINSIFKLAHNGTLPTYDIIILDEIEQLLSRMTGTGKDSIEHKALVFSTLMRLVKKAKKVICLDADVSRITFDFIEFCRPNEAFNYTVNEYKHLKKLYIYDNELDVINLAKDATGRNEPALFACNSLSKTEELAQMIDCENKRIINSKTSGQTENRLFLDDVNTQCKNDLLTIISPSVSTGFSIEGGHYKHNFGIFSHLVNTPLDCLQQLERDRVTTDKHVYISAVKTTYTTKSFDAAHDYNMMLIDGYGNEVYQSPCYSQLVKNVNESHKEMMHNFKSSFIRLAKEKGYEVIFVGACASKEELAANKIEKREIKAVIEEERVSLICAAELLDQSQYTKLKKKNRKTPADIAQVERFEIEQFYKTSVTPELVRVDGNGKRREQIKALKIAVTTEEAAISQQNINAKGKFVEDVDYITVKRLILSKVLQAVSITTELERTEDIYTSDNLQDFIAWADGNRAVLSAVYPNLPSLDRMIDNPYRIMGSLLGSMGITQKRVKARIDGTMTFIGYAINKDCLGRLKAFI